MKSEIAKIRKDVETIMGDCIAEAGDGPCVGCYMAVSGFIEDSPGTLDISGLAEADIAAAIENAAQERHRRRRAAGLPCGLPINQLPPELRAALVDIGGPDTSASEDPATNAPNAI